MENEEVKTTDSKVLAAVIVSYKLLGINKELAAKCMEELANRRASGDLFDFESYIDEKLKQITPEKNVNMKELSRAIKIMRDSNK